MRNKLLQLFARNRAKGEFRAEGNTIYVYDVIVASDADAEWWGGVSAESFAKTLKAMTGDVDVRVNSPGGDVFGAKAMAQAIREYADQVTVHVDGYAASAATFLTAVADETVMAEGAMLMIHDSWTIAIGNSDDFTSVAALLTKIDGTIADTYAAAAKRRGVDKSADDFAALMDAETWLTPDEAIALGMADRQAEDAPKVKASWDLSVYDHAPPAAKETPAPDPAPATPPEPQPAPADDVAPTPAPEPKQLARPNLKADLLLRPAA